MARTTTKKCSKSSLTSEQVGLKYGFRSGLEEQVAAELAIALGAPVPYEEETIIYVKPERQGKYTPDFRLPNGIFIETKGRFVTVDRQKHILIKDQHPDLDIRFIFSNPNSRISKKSKTTYAKWCETKGFLYAKAASPAALRRGESSIPEAWLIKDPKPWPVEPPSS